MCGIVGYVGNKNATQVLINAPMISVNYNTKFLGSPAL